jgi:hypothetical protein
MNRGNCDRETGMQLHDSPMRTGKIPIANTLHDPERKTEQSNRGLNLQEYTSNSKL